MKNLKRNFMAIFSLVLLVILSACGGGSSAEPSAAASNEVQEVTIKLAHEVAENTSQHAGSLAVKEYIEKESGGKIKVQIYPNGQLFGDKDVYLSLPVIKYPITPF